MAQGNYDHPSYLTRVHDYVGQTTAGANGTNFPMAFPTAIRLRQFTGVVVTAGTSTGAALNAILLNGTTTSTIGSIALSTSTANTVVTSTDPDYLVPAGALLYFTNGTDATSKVTLTMQTHLDPLLGTWGTP